MLLAATAWFGVIVTSGAVPLRASAPTGEPLATAITAAERFPAAGPSTDPSPGSAAFSHWALAALALVAYFGAMAWMVWWLVADYLGRRAAARATAPDVAAVKAAAKLRAALYDLLDFHGSAPTCPRCCVNGYAAAGPARTARQHLDLHLIPHDPGRAYRVPQPVTGAGTSGLRQPGGRGRPLPPDSCASTGYPPDWSNHAQPA